MNICFLWFIQQGILKNGDIVAVKKLAITSTRVNTEFESEVRLISNVHHRNIIRLLGCSAKGPEKLLVYEYMENGSLDTFLYGKMTLNFLLTLYHLNLLYNAL